MRYRAVLRGIEGFVKDAQVFCSEFDVALDWGKKTLVKYSKGGGWVEIFERKEELVQTVTINNSSEKE